MPRPVMNTSFILPLILLFLLLGTTQLNAQLDEDTRRVQWASGGRVGMAFNNTNVEPAASGSRRTFSYFYEQEFEARISEKWSFLAIFGQDHLQNYREAEPTAPLRLGNDPNIVDHPYTSELQTTFLRLGGQYNYRIGSGDLSLALTGGIAGTDYTRTYDFVARGSFSRRDQEPGFAVDESRPTFSLTYSARGQYLHWMGRKFAIGAGLQMMGFNYLSGGQETSEGLRFRLGQQGSNGLRARYAVNYDVDSLTVDPTARPVVFHWYLTVNSRF